MTEKLSKKAKVVWRLRVTLIFAAFLFICGGVYVFFPKIALMALGIALIIYLFIICGLIPYIYHITSLEIHSTHILIIKGFFFKKRLGLHADKIQYIELVQSPLQRIFKLYTVAFHTAGATVYIGQVDSDMARRYRALKE